MTDQMDFIGFELKGMELLKDQLEQLPPEAQDIVIDDVSEFMLDVLQAYPPKKRVTRRAAYGVTFFSDKQRRYFFWALNSGRIQVPYKRTQAFARGWKQVGSGAESLIVNEVPYGKFLMDEEYQSAMAFMIGWPYTLKVIYDHQDKLLKVAEAGVKKAIKKLDLDPETL